MCNPSKRKLIANVNKSRPERNDGDRKSVAGRRPPADVVVRGRTGGVKQGAGMRKMDLLAREGEKVI